MIYDLVIATPLQQNNQTLPGQTLKQLFWHCSFPVSIAFPCCLRYNNDTALSNWCFQNVSVSCHHCPQHPPSAMAHATMTVTDSNIIMAWNYHAVVHQNACTYCSTDSCHIDWSFGCYCQYQCCFGVLFYACISLFIQANCCSYMGMATSSNIDQFEKMGHPRAHLTISILSGLAVAVTACWIFHSPDGHSAAQPHHYCAATLLQSHFSTVHVPLALAIAAIDCWI